MQERWRARDPDATVKELPAEVHDAEDWHDVWHNQMLRQNRTVCYLLISLAGICRPGITS